MIKTALDRIQSWLTTAAGMLFVAVFAVTLLNIISRNLGGIALRWTSGVTRLTFIWSVLLSGSVLYRTRDHLIVDYFVQKANPILRRRMALFTDLLTLPFFVLAIIAGFRIAFVRMRISYEVWDFPTGYAYLALPIACIIMLIFNLERLYTNRKERT